MVTIWSQGFIKKTVCIVPYTHTFQSTKEIDSVTTVKVLAARNKMPLIGFNEGIIYRLSGASKRGRSLMDQQQQGDIPTLKPNERKG